MHDTSHLGLGDNAFLALAQDTGLPGTLPLDGAVIGISFIGTTFAPLAAGSPLLDSQGAVSGQHGALLPLAGHLLVQADAHNTRVVRDEWDLEDFTFIFTLCNRTCQEGGSQGRGDPRAVEQQQDAAGNPRRAPAGPRSQSPDAGEPEHRHLEGIPRPQVPRRRLRAAAPLAIRKAVGGESETARDGGGRARGAGRGGGGGRRERRAEDAAAAPRAVAAAGRRGAAGSRGQRCRPARPTSGGSDPPCPRPPAWGGAAAR